MLTMTVMYQDTFRAEWAWLILFAPERVPGMIRSMLHDYDEVSFVWGFIDLLTDQHLAGRLASYVEKYHR